VISSLWKSWKFYCEKSNLNHYKSPFNKPII